MTDAPTPPTSPLLIMALGPDLLPAAALSRAVGADLQPFDLATLGQTLALGKPCVVVWSDPAPAIAQALREATPPSVAARHWRDAAQDLLALFAKNRRRLLLIEAQVLRHTSPDSMTQLQSRLPMVQPLAPVDDPVVDLPAVLARLMSAHLSDLRPLWQELQGSSLSTDEVTFASADLDLPAQLLGEYATGHLARHQTDSDALAAARLETSLLRQQLAALSGAAADGTADLARRSDADRQAAARQASELALLRDQLASLTRNLPDSAPPVAAQGLGPAHVQIEAAFATLLAAMLTERDLRLQAQAAGQAGQSLPTGRRPVPARPNT